MLRLYYRVTQLHLQKLPRRLLGLDADPLAEEAVERGSQYLPELAKVASLLYLAEFSLFIKYCPVFSNLFLSVLQCF